MKLVLASCLLLLLLGCHGDTSIPLEQWSVSLPGSAIERPITLPQHLPGFTPDGARPGSYILRTTVALPPTFRGHRLTLTMTKLPAPATLRVNGEIALLLDPSCRTSYRVYVPRRWAITPAQSSQNLLSLELVLSNTWAPSGWLDTVPRLSRTPGGDRTFLLVQQWNYITEMMGFVAAMLASTLFLFLFLGNRRRHENGWYSLEAFCGALYPAFKLNLTQPLLGYLEVPLVSLGVSMAGVASVHLMHHVLRLKRPSRIWLWAWLLHLGLALVFHGPFTSPRYVTGLAGLVLGAAACYQVVRYGMAMKRGHHTGSLLASVGWTIVAVLGGLEIATWIGLGELLGGWHGAGFGIFIIALVQTYNLSREHNMALRTADSLNIQLADRVDALEASNAEIQQLNKELRHQISVRCQQLAATLAHPPDGDSYGKAIAPGSVIGDRYLVRSVIGKGGMGVVYRAERLTDNRSCALKVLKHQATADNLSRLAREAQILSQIEHPNIITIYDVNVSDSGQLYIVMELVDGTSLERQKARYGDVAWALPILDQTAQALLAIHDRQVVHRDLKPGNILLAEMPEGPAHVKVVDFGVASLVEAYDPSVLDLITAVDAPTLPPPGLSLTQPGILLGTPLYMAPEFVQGAKGIGPSADIFSFGVIAYEILTGTQPFVELPLVAALHDQALTLRQPIESLCAGLPQGLIELIPRCLQTSPDARPSARELVDLLGGSSRPPAEPPRS